MNNDIIEKLSKFSLVSAIIGLCTLGVCPAFGVMALVVPYVFKRKGAKCSEHAQSLCKKAQIIGCIDLVLFVVDLVLAVIFM